MAVAEGNKAYNLFYNRFFLMPGHHRQSFLPGNKISSGPFSKDSPAGCNAAELNSMQLYPAI